LTVTASDSGVGLNESDAYSFDGGTTRTGNEKTFYSNTTGTIRVRDLLGNISNTGYEINGIEDNRPTVELIGSPIGWILSGDTYIESGAIWYDPMSESSGTMLPTSGTVNETSTGVYILEYSTGNNAGTGTAFRTVYVLDPEGDEDGDGYKN
jgi:hypothetical protein